MIVEIILMLAGFLFFTPLGWMILIFLAMASEESNVETIMESK